MNQPNAARDFEDVNISDLCKRPGFIGLPGNFDISTSQFLVNDSASPMIGLAGYFAQFYRVFYGGLNLKILGNVDSHIGYQPDFRAPVTTLLAASYGLNTRVTTPGTLGLGNLEASTAEFKVPCMSRFHTLITPRTTAEANTLARSFGSIGGIVYNADATGGMFLCGADDFRLGYLYYVPRMRANNPIPVPKGGAARSNKRTKQWKR